MLEDLSFGDYVHKAKKKKIPQNSIEMLQYYEHSEVTPLNTGFFKY